MKFENNIPNPVIESKPTAKTKVEPVLVKGLDQPTVKQSTKPLEIAESSESIDEMAEFKQNISAAYKKLGFGVMNQIAVFDRDVLKEKYSPERLLNSPFYHKLIGSTAWTGLDLKPDEAIDNEIKQFVSDLAK